MSLVTPLTDASKMTLGPGTYPDPKCSGLRLVVSPKGKRVWRTHMHSPAAGKTVTTTLGLASEVSCKSARAKVDAMRVEHRKGGVKVEVGVPTFNQMVTSYNRPWATAIFDYHFADWLGMRLDKLTVEDVEARERRILAKAAAVARERNERMGRDVPDNAGATAVSKAAKALRAVFNHAKKRDLYTGRNLGTIMTIAKDNPRKVWMDDAQHARFLAALDDPATGLQPWARVYFRLLLATGSRRAALLKARWARIDFRDKVWNIPASDAKNGEENHVQLGPTAIKLLQEQRKVTGDSPFVFPSSQRDPMRHPIASPWTEWVKLRDAAKLDGFTMHDIRRTFGSMLVSRGAPMKAVSGALGHKSVKTTEEVYGHLAPKAIHEALQLLE